MSNFRVNGDMFGQYVKIPTGYSRQQHIYKVIGLLESNGYCDVPIVGHAEAKWHEESVPVLRVIHCGICEEEVIRVALKDCSPVSANRESYADMIVRLRNAAGGPEGVKMCKNAAEMISSLCIENTKLRADTVEVVRCKDCRYARHKEESKIRLIWCKKFDNVMRQFDFCSFGERWDDNAADRP